MSDFARLAGQQCPPQEALALELAVELGAGGGVAAARRSLSVLARALPAATDPTEQLDALRAVAQRTLRPRADGPHLLPDVLREGRGHPVGVAVALAVLARALEVDLAWRCAHETAGVVLRHVTTAAERSGDLTRSLGASALLLALPVDEASRAAQSAHHQRLLSRLN
jgi:hypothetical protein